MDLYSFSGQSVSSVVVRHALHEAPARGLQQPAANVTATMSRTAA
jgi:hypothetical protein